MKAVARNNQAEMKQPRVAAYIAAALIGFTLAGSDAQAQSPLINSLSRNGQLSWTYGYNSNTNQLARIETSTNLASGAWTPFYHDFVSTNLSLPLRRLPVAYDAPTNSLRTVRVPTNQSPVAFFRVAVQKNVPDPSLVLHLTFNNDFSRGIILDSSGYGNHGLRYGPTNWPSVTLGPDGTSQAAEFHVFPDNDPTYFGIGDYVSVLGSPSLGNLSRATIAVWAHYYAGEGGSYASDSRATLMDTAYGADIGSWSLGRENDDLTSFFVYTFVNSGAVMYFPDAAPTGDTGGWHNYVITFDGAIIRGYFDGKQVGSISSLGQMTQLRIGGADADYIALGTWAHGGTPQYRDDQYPNCCWMHGAIGDTRIYNRAFSSNEVSALYLSFDKRAPSIPANLSARTASSQQVELRWDSSTDDFAVAGYAVRRNGAVIGTATGTSYVDTGLAANTAYNYTVEAFDGAGNHSVQSGQVTTNTPAAGNPVAVIVDDEDGPQRIRIQGSWNFAANATGSYRSGFHSGTEGGGAQSVTYLPTLPAPGNYGVYLWFTGAISGGTPNYVWADNVPVDVVHNGVTNTVAVNEQQGYGTWVYVGNYTFTGSTNELVRIRTAGTSGHGQGYVAADAVMFTQ